MSNISQPLVLFFEVQSLQTKSAPNQPLSQNFQPKTKGQVICNVEAAYFFSPVIYLFILRILLLLTKHILHFKILYFNTIILCLIYKFVSFCGQHLIWPKISKIPLKKNSNK